MWCTHHLRRHRFGWCYPEKLAACEWSSCSFSRFSCQPYSRLGDGRSSADARSSCLTKTLPTAFYLQAKAIILECVFPAGSDEFVKPELNQFIQTTGYHCSQIDLRLDHVWPCRSHRCWWLLTAPIIGEVHLSAWPCFTNLTQVRQLIPAIAAWDISDERSLALDDVESDAFGVSSDAHGKHILKCEGCAPCALHAWGNQLWGYACGCRLYPLSASRLASKGLHGCLVNSAPLPDGSTQVRHLHPSEAMCLNTMDPLLDHGSDVRLTLSAVGQLAAPIQSLWVAAFLVSRLEELMKGPKHLIRTPKFRLTGPG